MKATIRLITTGLGTLFLLTFIFVVVKLQQADEGNFGVK